jgi:hypothetical protein
VQADISRLSDALQELLEVALFSIDVRNLASQLSKEKKIHETLFDGNSLDLCSFLFRLGGGYPVCG